MTLKKSSLLFKWAFLPERNGFGDQGDFGKVEIPHTSNVCRVFWRAVLLAPCFCLFIAGAVTIVAVTSPIWGLVWGISRLRENTQRKREPRPSIIAEFFRAKKQRLCPIVEITD